MDNSIDRIGTPQLNPNPQSHSRVDFAPLRQEPAKAAVPDGGSDAGNLADAVSNINEFIQIARRNLSFSVDEQSGRTIVSVIDADTKEVVRQIPPEEVLAVARNLDDLKGLLLKAEA